MQRLENCGCGLAGGAKRGSASRWTVGAAGSSDEAVRKSGTAAWQTKQLQTRVAGSRRSE